MKGARGAVCVALAVAFVASGCNSTLIRPPATVYADAGSRAIGASVGDLEGRFSSVLVSFFPSLVPLHPGDAVNFEVRDSGEPHSVALGRLVDTAVTALAELPTTAGVKTIEDLPQMKKLPSVLPGSVLGGAKVNGSAAERCFIDSGAPSVSLGGGTVPCEERDQPEFDGRQAFYSSGYLKEGEPFRVKLSPEIDPGTYSFMCLVHRSSMIGAIEVREPTVDRPPVAELRQEARAEENEVASTLEPTARSALTRQEETLLAGTGPEGRARGLLSSFVPNVARVRRNIPITWELYGMHSIAFNPSRKARDGILIEEGDGVRINEEAWEPVPSGQDPAALAFPPSAPNVEVDGGTWSGDGEFRSGLLRATPPATVDYSMKISKAGTYRYLCLVHPTMRGSVEVS